MLHTSYLTQELTYFLQDVVWSELGATVKSEVFKITLAEVSDGNGVEFSGCPRPLMEAIVEAAAGYTDLSDLEQVIHTGILEWLDTPQVLGWHIRLPLIPATRELGVSGISSTTGDRPSPTPCCTPGPTGRRRPWGRGPH